MKTTAAYLYARATLCENRSLKEFEPCNKCDSCLTKIDNMNHPNITYYRITEASSFKEAVNDLISMTKAKPVLTHSNIRNDNYRRFIIIDEIQSATKQSISPFLDSLEFASEYVTIILISMDIHSMDPIVKDAIESRCIELSLTSLDIDSISIKLTDVYPDLDKHAANLIAYLSKGNLRQAWAILQFFATQFDVKNISIDCIAEQKLNNLTNKNIDFIIQSLQNKDWKHTNYLIDKYIKDSEICVNFFLRSLLAKDIDLKGIELVSSLSFWLQSNYKVPIASIFRIYQNCNLLKVSSSEKVIDENIMLNTNQHIKKTTNDIKEQLARITGTVIYDKIPIPKFLAFSSWRQFIEKYAFDN